MAEDIELVKAVEIGLKAINALLRIIINALHVGIYVFKTLRIKAGVAVNFEFVLVNEKVSLTTPIII